MRKLYLRSIPIIIFGFISLFTSGSIAKTTAVEKPVNKINVVIHVTQNGGRHYRAALNYAYVIRDEYGKENVNIEIVANGPGIGLVNSNNKYGHSIKRLMNDGVRFSACNTTARYMREHQELPIIENVKFVPYGVVRVLELQRKGYLYLRP